MKSFCSYRYLSSFNVPSLQLTASVSLHSTVLTSLLYLPLYGTEVSTRSTSILYCPFLLYLSLCYFRYLFVTLEASLFLYLPCCCRTYLSVTVLTSPLFLVWCFTRATDSFELVYWGTWHSC